MERNYRVVKKASIYKEVHALPEGSSEGIYKNRRYHIIKSYFNNGKSLKIYAEELGGNDFISLNFYETSSGDLVKPCEMPLQKVVHFLKNVILSVGALCFESLM